MKHELVIITDDGWHKKVRPATRADLPRCATCGHFRKFSVSLGDGDSYHGCDHPLTAVPVEIEHGSIHHTAFDEPQQEQEG